MKCPGWSGRSTTHIDSPTALVAVLIDTNVRQWPTRGGRAAAVVAWCLVAMAQPTAVLAQSDSSRVLISGVILDPQRKPIEGAEVRVVGSRLLATSGATGLFRLLAPRDKEVLVHVRRVGYKAQLLKTVGDWRGAIVLEPGAFELPEIQVVARYAKPARYAATTKYDDYFRRRRQGIGQFIDREEIDRKAPLAVAELLTGRAGIKVSVRPAGQGTTVFFARCNEYPPRINVYLDGRKLIPIGGMGGGPSVLSSRRGASSPMIGEMLERVDVHDVELMEIFRGPGELPPEYNDGNCGAIVIWTRQGGQ